MSTFLVERRQCTPFIKSTWIDTPTRGGRPSWVVFDFAARHALGVSKQPGPDDLARGRRIRDARNLAGLSQQELADRVGASRASVINWEAGVHPRSHMVKLRDVLGSSLGVPSGGDALSDPTQLTDADLMARVSLLLIEANRRLVEYDRRLADAERRLTEADRQTVMGMIEHGEMPDEARTDPNFRGPKDNPDSGERTHPHA